jgi:hypothetical protein
LRINDAADTIVEINLIATAPAVVALQRQAHDPGKDAGEGEDDVDLDPTGG